MPFARREQVAGLIRYHQVPSYLLDREDPLRLCIEVSQSARCDHLALLAEADVLGRVCADQQRLLDNVNLFAEYCQEQGCFSSPYLFPSDHSRFLYFAEGQQFLYAPAHEDFRAEVVVMSGLPGAGKDYYIRQHLSGWPVLSLDALREELDVSPEEKQGEVVNEARQRAREYLRQGISFVWNATNLSRMIRGSCIQLLRNYNARVRITYIEVPCSVLFEQNRQRQAMVPQTVIETLLDRWEVPDPTECHQVAWVVKDAV